ncbi:aldehyde dehydrogenase family protein [Achromobacter sp. AONIH1]|uniref:aldehyde dehydrogenase family protein n=1 Tax=Achromobacter sp. AONIH1 TaxID=1758194 RepID=UPI000CD034D3|nr:aldehyde dehydrogenase family protein [Achromobacter sp. AONIH1]AUT48791.1 aldehyde dehydrogenase [Achromobacter sp. AONIH1]
MKKQLTTISPIDGSLYVQRDLATDTQIAQALTHAHAVQKDWARQPIAHRIRILSTAIDRFVANKEIIAEGITRQMGRPIRYAGGEVDGFAARARHMLSIAEASLRPIQAPPQEGYTRYITREPAGVVFTIAPWNYPLLTAVNSIVPALAAGNAVILKHSDQTPLCAEWIHQAFVEAGLPPGLFQYLHVDHDAVRRIIESNQVNVVCFTGSVAGGRAIEQAAAGRFIGVGLELGGNDPAYVREDANLGHAVETLVDGAFFNSGQSCCGIQRIYVAQRHYDAFVQRAVALTNQYVLGNPLDPATTLGPVVRASAADGVRAVIADALAKGAKNLIDPQVFGRADDGGPYLAPGLFVNVDHTMTLMNDECFGPVVGIMPVRDDEQAIALMNSSPYGLTASVFTTDEQAAIGIGQRLETGTFFMNRCDYLDPALAWTGVKHSGRGATLSQVGYEHLTRPKSFHLKRHVQP